MKVRSARTSVTHFPKSQSRRKDSLATAEVAFNFIILIFKTKLAFSFVKGLKIIQNYTSIMTEPNDFKFNKPVLVCVVPYLKKIIGPLPNYHLALTMHSYKNKIFSIRKVD